MPFIARLPSAHSIQDFRSAARMRFNEGRRLALAGDRLAAIYFWGYAAEMLLKAAYFRLSGWLPGQAITMNDLTDAKKYAVQTLGLHCATNLHDLPRWRELLVEDRILRLVPYSPAFSRSLNARVNRIYINWREHLRYRVNRPYQGEVTGVFQAVTWLFGQFQYL